MKVICGGSWISVPLFLRFANYFEDGPDGHNFNLGFRLVRDKITERIIRGGSCRSRVLFEPRWASIKCLRLKRLHVGIRLVRD